jgi:hypothetical protein
VQSFLKFVCFDLLFQGASTVSFSGLGRECRRDPVPRHARRARGLLQHPRLLYKHHSLCRAQTIVSFLFLFLAFDGHLTFCFVLCVGKVGDCASSSCLLFCCFRDCFVCSLCSADADAHCHHTPRSAERNAETRFALCSRSSPALGIKETCRICSFELEKRPLIEMYKYIAAQKTKPSRT